MSDHRKYWIALNSVKGIGPVRILKLLDAFGALSEAWIAPREMLLASGLGPKLTDRLIQARSEMDIDKIWENVLARSIQVLTWEDDGYPLVLKTIRHPPPLLYVDGSLRPDDDPAVAVVGTRRPSAYGRRVAQEIGATLARAGVTVVSGLARGIDSLAHKEALRSGGRTIAVLGSGLDQIYPPENRSLCDAIRQNGALISDYPLGTMPEAVNFPPRNRIISGLSRAVAVVEAGVQSGAMITASFAADQGREVFSVPGPIYSSHSKGTNLLIQQGARPLLEPSELLDYLNLEQLVEYRTARKVISTDPLEAEILRLIDEEALNLDDICAVSGRSVEQISPVLSIMELKGMVRRDVGMRYLAIREQVQEYTTI